MTDTTPKRPRGPSAWGNFETAKTFATTSEEARVAAEKRKTEALREARLKKTSKDGSVGTPSEKQ